MGLAYIWAIETNTNPDTWKVRVRSERNKVMTRYQINALSSIFHAGDLSAAATNLFRAIVQLPEKTAESFHGEWFSAGDMGLRDEDGFYQIVDRKDNMIITGGENVYPSEVEEVVGSHPDVYDAAVIGLPDDKWGERVAAIVIKKPGAELDAETLRAYCKDKIAGYKRPKDIIFIESDGMPRTATGKILHRILRERFA